MKNVLREVTKLQFYKDELDEEIERRTSWQRDELLWYAPFSPRQAIDALSIKKKTPLQFIKAAHTIILCEMALRESQKLYGVTVNTSDLYRNMYIEPALFYIEGFDTFYINRTSTQREQVLAKLSIETRQRFSGVFVDMAHGATVTYSLAKKVKEIMDREYQGSVGEIDFRFHHMSIGASRMEHLINL